MSSLFCDPGVFIRSMATRGSLGGLALKTKEVCDLLDAFGHEIIIIETVGVGQAELDVAKAAHTTLIALVPESGDGIQAMKAGLMEIGDIFIVNKSDREGSDRLVAELELMLDMKEKTAGWKIPVLSTVAINNQGIVTLYQQILAHWDSLKTNEGLKNIMKQNVLSDIQTNVLRHLSLSLWNDETVKQTLTRFVDEIVDGKMSPLQAAEQLITLWQGRSGSV